MVVNFGGTHSSHCKEGLLFVYVSFPDLVIILWANLAVFLEPGRGRGWDSYHLVCSLLLHIFAFWALHLTGPGGADSGPSSPQPSASVCRAFAALAALGMGGWWVSHCFLYRFFRQSFWFERHLYPYSQRCLSPQTLGPCRVRDVQTRCFLAFPHCWLWPGVPWSAVSVTIWFPASQILMLFVFYSIYTFVGIIPLLSLS